MKSLLRSLTLACICLNFSSVFAEPPVAPFYESLKTIKPAGKLGQIIKQEKIKTSVKGAQAWKIAYISSDLNGQKTIVTGLVVAPVGAAPKEGRPIMSWAHGTTGAAQNCGPSQVLDPVVPLNEYFLLGGNSWTDYGIPSIAEFINEGYVVVATDYQGQGGGGRHQYALAATNSMDTIDAARAASSMKETGAGKKTIIYGWSQGGAVSIAAASMPEYFAKKGTASDNLELIGTVAMAPDDIGIMIPGATDNQASAQKSLDGLIKMFSGNVFNFAHMAMSMWGVQAANPNLKLTDIFTQDGAKALDEVISNKCMHAFADTLNYNYSTQYKTLLKDQSSNALEWTKTMIRGSVNPIKPIAPVVIYWGNKDVTNPPIMGKLYQEQMCKLGGNVNRVELPGDNDHFTTPGSSKSLYLSWIKDRLAAKPATNNCVLAAQLPS
ncbi:alpha/beta fold hydrolase [Polynucleobacter sp. CS-Odin-A6]|uniref:alpha/beta fold hydrolase n=1 Tax=Polynucleobacter sp. CS-Odin-A6 TaxID=2689106 RepID=UPI001C0D3EE8|nr:alpha/beta fold hydrolase [Polynucleobacter sp. CS-Odin-A6]MBU3620893.1 alpha/beta fold hydrolase [Polynucleobacter sp. CS-Odin-A6]